MWTFHVEWELKYLVTFWISLPSQSLSDWLENSHTLAGVPGHGLWCARFNCRAERGRFFFQSFFGLVGFCFTGKGKKGARDFKWKVCTVYCILMYSSTWIHVFFLGHLLHDYGALIFDFVLHDYGAVSRGIDWDFEHLFFRTIWQLTDHGQSCFP